MGFNLRCFHVCIILLTVFFRLSYQISCRSETNKEIDWYVNYKLPKIEQEPSGTDLGEGRAYAYITAPGSRTWKLSRKSIMSGSMLENTMNDFYDNKQSLTYLFYNDEPPANFSGTAVGHLKGVLAFDKKTGFWLVHSIPKFADDKAYQYPDNAILNGQSILCVTFKTTELNEICNQLLYSHPNIYSYALTDDVKAMLGNPAKTLFTKNPSFMRNPVTRSALLKSAGNKQFRSFAKDNQCRTDLYSGIIAVQLQASLVVETWRRGSGTVLPPSCQSDYSVLDVSTINMAVTVRRNDKNIAFKYTEDHSKWAISDSGSRNWICIADMNRMASQERRGGGALCFVSSPVWNAFKSIISETDKCPVSRSTTNTTLPACTPVTA